MGLDPAADFDLLRRGNVHLAGAPTDGGREVLRLMQLALAAVTPGVAADALARPERRVHEWAALSQQELKLLLLLGGAVEQGSP